MLVKIWTLGSILMRSQTEIGNMFNGKQRKADPCSKMAKNLAELCSCSNALWKLKLTKDATGYLVEEISQQSMEGVAQFLLTAYSKMHERNEVKKKLLSKKDHSLKI